jgi:predicted glycosyltransferase
MIFDFVGCDAMTANTVDRAGAYALNALWAFDRTVYDGARHSALFIGEPEDVPDVPLGRALPNKREHALAHYHFVGHAIGFRPEDLAADRAAVRRALGYDERPLVVCAVGGTAIGRALLETCAAASLPLRESLPDARMVLVCGPRIPVDAVHAPSGVEVRGYVPRLYEHFACCDVAVVQCGASATTELAALGTPFVYVPVEGHFEQEIVCARLARYGIGRRLSLPCASPEALAAAILEQYRGGRAATAMPTDGTRLAAEHILHVLHSRHE